MLQIERNTQVAPWSRLAFEESLTRSEESSTRDKEPSTRDKESSTRDKESSTRDKESSTRDKEPSTRDKQNAEVAGEARYFCAVLTDNEDFFEQRVVAFYVVSRVLDELHILNLAVEPGYQGKGFGHDVMQELFDLAAAQNLDKLLLEVRASNHAAQSLYCKWGFEQIGLRKNYYRTQDKGREDALVLMRQLTKTVKA